MEVNIRSYSNFLMGVSNSDGENKKNQKMKYQAGSLVCMVTIINVLLIYKCMPFIQPIC